MRLLRSMAALAVCACLSIMIVPLAAAAAPLDPGLTVAEKSYPAPVVDVVAIVAEVPAAPAVASRLSQLAAIMTPVVVVPLVRPTSPNLIRPHIRC